MLVQHVLKSRFPSECAIWEKQLSEIDTEGTKTKQKQRADAQAEREEELPFTQEALTRVLATKVIDIYPYANFLIVVARSMTPYIDQSLSKAWVWKRPKILTKVMAHAL